LHHTDAYTYCYTQCNSPAYSDTKGLTNPQGAPNTPSSSDSLTPE